MTLAAFRETRARSKRAAIVAAASRLFAEQGYQVSTAALAAEAGVSTATLYRHFESKDALFGAVVDALVDDVIQGVANRPSTGTDPLRTLALRFARLLCNPLVVGLIRGIVADTSNSGAFRDRLERHGSAIFENEFRRAIETLLREHNPEAIPDIQQARLELVAPIEHETLFAALLFHNPPAPDALDALVDRNLASWRRRWLPRT